MIEKLNEIDPKKEEDVKVMFNKIEALKVKYQDQAKILDNNTISMHIFLVYAQLYKNELMQDLCMNIAQRIESISKGIMQVGEGEVALTNSDL